MANLLIILAAVSIVSLLSFTGILFIGLKKAFLNRILTALIGFASGSLIGSAFFHLIPEALEDGGQTTFYFVITGIMFFFIMEKFLY